MRVDAEGLRLGFEEHFREKGELGASLSVFSEGAEVLNLCGGVVAKEGAAWAADTLVPVWSTTKGPAAATLLVVLDREGLGLETPVQRVWPELRARVTFGQLLSHQAGLPALDGEVSVFDHAAVVHALERQEPAWEPGRAHGYHPRTFGFLLDECVRRLTHGLSLGRVWREEIAGPGGFDVWMGVRESEVGRVATVYPGRLRLKPEEAAFSAAYGQAGSLTRRSFSSLKGLNAVSDFNSAALRSGEFPAFGGVASARGLAKFYSALVTAGSPLFTENVQRWAGTALAEGVDEVLRMPVRFTAGFQQDPLGPDGVKLRRHYGRGLRAFGHPGAGGSVAWADPERGLGVAYVLNQVEPGVFPSLPSLAEL